MLIKAVIQRKLFIGDRLMQRNRERDATETVIAAVEFFRRTQQQADDVPPIAAGAGEQDRLVHRRRIRPAELGL